MSIVLFARPSRRLNLVCRPIFHSIRCASNSQHRLQVSNSLHVGGRLDAEASTKDIKKPPDLIIATDKPIQNTENNGLLRRILLQVNVLIEELSHMDDVRISQQKVIQLKDKLFEAGQRKREILYKLSEIRNELKRLQSDSVAIRRGTEGYLTLVRNEIELHKEEASLQSTYDKADEEERSLFTSLTAAINDSYEREKIHANTLRLWGLIGTLFTSIITLILSTIGHYYHTTQLGLVGSKFKDADKISKEVGSLSELVMQLQQQIRGRDQKTANTQKSATGESWGAYLSRHTSGIYRYFFPKRQ